MAPIKRGCGYRVAGGAYIVTGTSKYGKPVEDFLVEPKRPVDPEQMGLAAIGVMPFKITADDDQTHLLNWVGESGYPNVTDFIEEVRRFGASTRISANFPFESIKGKPYIYHVHARAWLENAMVYQLDPPAQMRKAEAEQLSWMEKTAHYLYGDYEMGRKECPKSNHADDDIDMCARLWWEDVHGGEYVVGTENDREVRRSIGDTEYRGYTPPKGVVPEYKPAVFFRLPIHAIEVVKDPARNRHEEVLEKSWYSDIETRVVDF